jgi:hypothetical protein
MAAAAVAQDRTANRVAMCSAIIAGFAYVGYAVVRRAFGGGKRRDGAAAASSGGFLRNENDVLGLEYEDEEESSPAIRNSGRQRIYLRRLSGSMAAANGNALFDGQSSGGGGHCILRPFSVRERIRELNLSALAFADTVLVLQGKILLPFSFPWSFFSRFYIRFLTFFGEKNRRLFSIP